MALWGNNNSRTASGTANISSNGFVNGTSTSFQTQMDVGNFITMANVDYLVVSITSNTQARVVGSLQNTTVIPQSNGAYAISEKPSYVVMDFHGGSNGHANAIFGVDSTEVNVANGAVREVVFTNRGSGYTANATVTFAGGVGNTVAVSANATATNGAITSINFANNGARFTIPPTCTISAPDPIYFTGNVTGGSVVLGNATSNSTQFKLDNGYIITDANTQFLANGALVTYRVLDSNVAIGGLSNNTTYTVYTINSTAIALYTSLPGGTRYINLSSVSATTQANHAIIGVRATAVPILSGVRKSEHAGWVRRNVGQGGRAGRVTFETLVAMGSIQGDAADNDVFPNA